MGQNSLKRGTAVIGMAPDLDPASWDHSELERYGLGSVRDVQLFYKLFLIDTQARKATQLCPFVNSGIMHRDFQPYLRADGNGIDYSYLKDYDTRDVLARRPRKDQPHWAREIDKGMGNGDPAQVRRAIAAAKKIGVYESKPDLKNRAEYFLNQH
jgi:hypothetical protein